ncbi:exopolysaccharide glucosyl ketal-pyruvate-transferase [Persicobacter diffluens]|uniref:Exopolysaccharide glucosyl ketal-pyruvate-transferase n=2 Tax=Persicobacter diffluens TaxID=981 RepID=A0AAN4VVD1_9BACT|nr:exopolysaccharide glucosyl ketal-pyruvate-transferase [Persicobacter diffluens]
MWRKYTRLWWCGNEGVFNFGDELNPWLVEKISKTRIKRVHKLSAYNLFKTHICIGSVMNRVNKRTVVWGAGIMDKDTKFEESDFRAVRGPLTQKRIKDQGFCPPSTVGDPALLLPRFYLPERKERNKYGLIPHYVDYADVLNRVEGDGNIKVIDLTGSIEQVIDEINACEIIFSSSLHGIIVANAYGKQAYWLAFSDKLSGDGTKFFDYGLSVGMGKYQINCTKVNSQQKLDSSCLEEIIVHGSAFSVKVDLELMQDELLESCPFY